MKRDVIVLKTPMFLEILAVQLYWKAYTNRTKILVVWVLIRVNKMMSINLFEYFCVECAQVNITYAKNLLAW